MRSYRAGALVFFTSATVLIIEILAGRLLAPYAGVTLETFTAIIGVVLGGIALGTWLGGRLADRVPSPVTLLGPALIAGAALAAATVPIARALGPSMGRAGVSGLVLLTAIAVLPPTSVLSAVPPIVVKVVLRDLETTGRTVGQISALGTTGALFGTFVSGFLLVAALPTSTILFGLSLVTALVGISMWMRYRPADDTLTFAAGALLIGGGLLTSTIQTPCDLETAYFCAAEVPDAEDEDASFLVLDTITHAYIDRTDPTHLRFTSIRMFASAIDAMTAGPLRVLHIGGGGFSVPSWLTATRPGSQHTVLELDPALVTFVQANFDPAPVERLLIGDARVSLSEAGTGFDAVVGDAFGGLAVPWHLTTGEFLEEISTTLGDDGFYVMNLIDHGNLDFLKAELATARAVFPNVAIVTVPERFEVGGNFMLVASKRAIPIATIIENGADRDLVLSGLTGSALDDFIGDAAVLTDDFAPVDQLIETS